ncbi:hypothetical protein BC833DRAFT_579848 [Globomyces pollinis-pini]|nr:hypothetical protein BC833DRAFT_579848 [Globomyces pollinis-pini]
MGALALLFNAATGPAIPFTPNAFQNPGWLFAVFFFLVFGLISTFAILFLIEAIQAIPGNKHFQGDVEYATMINFYFGPTFHIISQFVLYCALHAQSIQSIILSAQAIDHMLVDINSTCGLTFAWDISKISWVCVREHGDKLSPFGDQFMLFTFGILVVALLVIPMTFTDLDGNMGIQYVSFFISLMMCAQWISASFTKGLDFQRVMPTNTSLSNYGEVLGTIMLNMAVTLIIPSWVNIKSKDINIQRSVWAAMSIVTLSFVSVGFIVALAFISDNPNSLTVISQFGTPRIPSQITYYLFAFVFLIPTCPVNFIIAKDNLVQNEVTGEKLGFFLGFVLPWFLCIPIQTGNLLPIVQNWTSTLFVATSSYILPILLYFQCREFRKRYNSERSLSKHQYQLLLKIHHRSSHITSFVESKMAALIESGREVPEWLNEDVPDPEHEDEIEQMASHNSCNLSLQTPENISRVPSITFTVADETNSQPLLAGADVIESPGLTTLSVNENNTTLLTPDILVLRGSSSDSHTSQLTHISFASTLPALSDWKTPAFRAIPKWFPVQEHLVAIVVIAITSTITVCNIILMLLPK